MKQYIKSALKTFYDGVVFKGKANKEEYVVYIFFMVLFPAITYLMFGFILWLSKYILFLSSVSIYFATLALTSLFIPMLSLPALTVRRLNDANKSKLFLVLFIIPFFIPTMFRLLVLLIILIYFANIGKNNNEKIDKDEIIRYDQ